jgi:hypothetical protein
MKLSRRQQYTVLAVLGALLVVGAAVSEIFRARSVPGSGTPTPAPKGELGPTPGPDAEGYISEKRAKLDELAAAEPERDAAALVSFSRMVRSVDVTDVLGSLQVDAVFHRFPGAEAGASTVVGTVEVVVGQAAAELAEARDAEIEDLGSRMGAAQGEERVRMEQDIAERRVWLNELRGECFCVYAVAVRGANLSELAELARHPDVRLVDVPDPPVADLRGWELRPILPRTA